MDLPPLYLSSKTAGLSSPLTLDYPLHEDLGRFNLADISIITFGSPGIPSYANTNASPLRTRTLDIYNSGDFVHNHTGDVYGIPLSWAFNGFAHVGIPKPLYTPYMQHAHNPQLYKSEIENLTSSTLFNFAGPQTVFVFGGTDSAPSSSNEIINVSSTSLGIPKAPYFLVSQGGIDTLVGGPNNDLIEVVAGNHVLTGGGGNDQFQVFSGEATITDFDYRNDSLYLPSNYPVLGRLANGGTLLTFIGADQRPGQVLLKGVDLNPIRNQWSWLRWGTGFDGDQVTLTTYSPTRTSADLIASGTATVVPGKVIFPSFAALTPGPASGRPIVLDESLTISGNTMTFLYPPTYPGATISSGAFNGTVIQTAANNPAITGAKLVNTNLGGLTPTDFASHLSFSAHEVDFNEAGLTLPTDAQGYVVLSFDFVGQSTSASSLVAHPTS